MHDLCVLLDSRSGARSQVYAGCVNLPVLPSRNDGERIFRILLSGACVLESPRHRHELQQRSAKLRNVLGELGRMFGIAVRRR
jgi:hypothetical protein